MSRPDWYLDELAHAGPEHRDPAYIAAYDRKAGTDPATDLAALQKAGLDETSVLVDLGAGTGTFTVAAAPHCHRVIAVDVSPAMLAALRANVAARGLANVTVANAGFLSYAHEGPPADFVYSRNALHHLPDFWKGIALARVAALLRPGGTFFLRDLVYDFAPSGAEGTIERWLSGAAARAAEGWTRAELAEHLRDEYSTYTWLLEPLLERAGFAIRERRVEGPGTYAAYSCVKR
jgi:SAM-dependent methyltransferase